MLTILGGRRRANCDGVTRRDLLRAGSLGLGGLALPQLLQATAGEQRPKSIIMIYLPGGPPHLDLFDLKMQAPREVRGPFEPIQTSVPGVQICELLPNLARIMDRLVLIRSLVGAKNRHESFQCYSGRAAGRPGDIEPGGGWPTIGSVISHVQGAGPAGMPPFVDLGPEMSYGPYRLSGLHDNSPKVSWPGFLGIHHTPFRVFGKSAEDLVLNQIPARVENRKSLLSALSDFRRRSESAALENEFDEFHRQALGILTSGRMAQALDLKREDPRVIARYGAGGPTTGSFGGAIKSPQHFLMARRLVEAGVRCVTVAFGAWDWHGNRGGTLEKLAREDVPMLDHALAVLVEDLEERGLLDDVSIVVWGEFGRTPRINDKGGRDHWEKVACALLAGGGMPGGQVIGSTDRFAQEAAERPVHMQEVFATLYHNIGIDVATATVTDLAGRPHYLVDEGRRPISELV